MNDPTTGPFRDAAVRDAAAGRDLAEADPAVTGARSDDEVSKFATHGDPTLSSADPEADARRGRVQWVRPTDLAARAGGAVVDQGAKWNTLLHDAALEGIREGRAQLRERLAHRQDELEPNTPDRALQPVAGRTGVSR